VAWCPTCLDHKNNINNEIIIRKKLDNSGGAIKNEQSRETGNIGYTSHRTKRQKQNTEN
jgi:hypothetical protein